MNTKAPKKTAKRNFSKNNTENKQDKFISKILENLEKVNADEWEKYTNYSIEPARNLFTQKRYKGFNLMALYIDQICNNYSSSNYATFKSISDAGGILKKGSKGTVIEFFSYIYKNVITKKTLTEEQVRVLSNAERENVKKYPCIRNYVVFNASLIENIEDLNLNIKIEEVENIDFEDQKNCENFISNVIENGGLNLKVGNYQTACYVPLLDEVRMPKKEICLTENKYYTTLFHEIVHWTGHEDRLERDLKGHSDIASYSFEELIAEMGSMIISLQFGILDEIINSIRYLKFWLTKNKIEDNEANLREAFTQSKRAKKFLENL